MKKQISLYEASILIKNSCNGQGCDIRELVLPYAGTKESFNKYVKSK